MTIVSMMPRNNVPVYYEDYKVRKVIRVPGVITKNITVISLIHCDSFLTNTTVTHKSGELIW